MAAEPDDAATPSTPRFASRDARRVTLRTRLARAFLLLAVVPLAVVTVFSYLTSRRVVRVAIEAEASAVAEGMGSRMEVAASELARRTEALKERTWKASPEYARARREALEAAEKEEIKNVLRGILSLTQRDKGEIPFAIDADGRFQSSSREDLEALQGLAITRPPAGGGPPVSSSASGDWVIVASRPDPVSGVTLGIARPVGEPLRGVRRTAVLNLGLGLAVVGIALLGILPLSRRMTRDLRRLSTGAERLAAGDLTVRVPVPSSDEFGKLAEAFNRMAYELSLHQQRLLRQERLRKELEMCRRIQEDLLPREPLRDPGVEARGISIPAREVGGDFFNYFSVAPGRVAVVVGDVSGKGVGAALLMANVQATLRARLPLESDLAHLADHLDREIEAATPPEVYLTLFMAIIAPAEGELRYVSAGHEAQYVLRGREGLEALESTGRPIGLLPGAGYVESRVALRPGEGLFLFTDGLTEAENPAGEPFGDRLREILLAYPDREPEELLAALETAVREHQRGVELADDATMVALRMSRGSAERGAGPS
jgi:serine phosphatase RsbU (regulator of sigma subunit)